MVSIHSWVAPISGTDSELIVGRVVSIGADPTDVRVAWLSNERGLWVNDEYGPDLESVEVPSIVVIEAIMVSATPILPYGYES